MNDHISWGSWNSCSMKMKRGIAMQCPLFSLQTPCPPSPCSHSPGPRRQALGCPPMALLALWLPMSMANGIPHRRSEDKGGKEGCFLGVPLWGAKGFSCSSKAGPCPVALTTSYPPELQQLLSCFILAGP